MTDEIKRETVIIIYDRNGKFYNIGFIEERCKQIAETLRGSYRIVQGD